MKERFNVFAPKLNVEDAPIVTTPDTSVVPANVFVPPIAVCRFEYANVGIVWAPEPLKRTVEPVVGVAQVPLLVIAPATFKIAEALFKVKV